MIGPMPVEPNSVRAAPQSRVLIVLSIALYGLMAFGGVVLLAAGAARGVNAVRIASGPVDHATAAVSSRDVDNGRLEVVYAFQPPGSALTYVGIVEVSPDEYASALPQSPVAVEYLRDDPNVNWRPGQSPLLGEVIACGLGLVLGVFVLAVTQWRFGIRGVREAWRASSWP
jgi:hypothetical protein